MKFTLAFLLALFLAPSLSHGMSNSSAYANLGFSPGGLAFGGDFEMARDRIYGIGAFARIYSKDEDSGYPGIFAFGAFIRPHFQRGPWDLYVSPGFALMFIDGASEDETTIGPVMNIGLLYLLTNNVSLGLEHSTMVPWFGDAYKGVAMSDLHLKVRYQF